MGGPLIGMDETKRVEKAAGKGWRRLFIILAVLWLPITVVLNSLGRFDSYGDGAIYFFVFGLVVVVSLAFAAPWIARGFQSKDHTRRHLG